MAQISLKILGVEHDCLLAVFQHQLEFLVLLEGCCTVRVNDMVCWIKGLYEKLVSFVIQISCVLVTGCKAALFFTDNLKSKKSIPTIDLV